MANEGEWGKCMFGKYQQKKIKRERGYTPILMLYFRKRNTSFLKKKEEVAEKENIELQTVHT